MITVSLYTVLFIGEALVVTIFIALYFFFRSKKYQPYYKASESPQKALKEYLVEEILHTRDYIKSIDSHAKQQDETACTRQRNLDIRVQWLDIEKNFIETPYTASVYWRKLCKKIDVFFKNWQPPIASCENVANEPTLEELENDPAEDMILLSSEDDHDPATHHSDFSKEREALLIEIKQLHHENDHNKRTAKDLLSYKRFFLEMQKTYDQLNKKYKKLHHTLDNMQLQPDQIEQLQPILNEGNDDELEQQVKSLAQENERLQSEMNQMEAIFNLQREEVGQSSTIANDETTETTLVETSHSETALPSAAELDTNFQLTDKAPDTIGEQETALNHYVDTLEQSDIPTEIKQALENKMELLQKTTIEMHTCYKVLEFENERLLTELDALKQTNSA